MSNVKDIAEAFVIVLTNPHRSRTELLFMELARMSCQEVVEWVLVLAEDDYDIGWITR